VFGCWTSISRKFVLPVFEELDSMLFYPVQYEGEECSRNIFYTGAAPNQQAIPAVDYLMSSAGGNRRRFVLLGTDYVYPRTTNTILEAYLKSLNIPDADVKTIYTPFGHSDWSVIVSDIIEFSQGVPTAVVSTVNGDANVPFYQELAKKKISAQYLPVVAFSVGEGELAGLDTTNLVGHLASWNYFMSINNTLNHEFIQLYKEFTKDPKAIVNDPMEAHYIGFKLWVQAVQQSKCVDSNCVRQALYQQRVKSLSGYTVGLHTNHHLDKPIVIGEIRTDGQFNILSQVPPVIANPWSPHLHNPIPTADWSYPWVCGKCLAPNY
jgi:urea transport system substrate-binding protein